MKVTALKPSLYIDSQTAVFIDSKYFASLSADSLLKSKLVIGQELSKEDLNQLNKLAEIDKFYLKALKYISKRQVTKFALKQFLRKNGASSENINTVVNKLSNLKLVDDYSYALSYINDKIRYNPTSNKKIYFELIKKKIPKDIIEKAMLNSSLDEDNSLHHLIEKKRRIKRFQDNLKLSQYLVRQGYSYSSVKQALSDLER